MSLSVVIPTRNTFGLAEACVASVVREAAAANLASEIEPLQVIVVDDGGNDDAATRLAARWPAVEAIRLTPSGGFSVAANRGIASARGDLVLLLNSDTELRPASLAPLLRAFDSPRVGIVGGALCYPDGTPQWSGGAEPTLLWLFALTSGIGRWRKRRPYAPPSNTAGAFEERAWVTGAALAARRRVFDECGPLATDYHFYAQDLELCLRARDLGWRVGVAPDFGVLHHHGATIDGDGGEGHQRLEYLWPDLLRAFRRRRGDRAARRARMTMTAGGEFALLVARLTGNSPRASALARALRRLSTERLDRQAEGAARLPPQ